MQIRSLQRGGAAGTSGPPRAEDASATARRVVLIAFLTILLVSAALRFALLDRYPIGWHHDEALMGVMAQEVVRGVERPIFFRQYLGQEPFYIYASAGMMALLDNQDILPLRLTSALIGLLTVVMTFLLGRRLFGTRVGLLGMALIGLSFWQVMSSRNGYRSISQPLFEALATLLFLKALDTRQLRWYALAGLALGGTLYTYLGARAFPAVFLGFACWLLITRRQITPAAVQRGALLALVAALVISPLAAFFIANPGTWNARMGQVFIFQPGVSHGHPWHLLADNLVKMLGGFTFLGEPLWRYNIPGRPMFVGPLVVAFYIGVVVLAVKLWRRSDEAALVVIWMGVMFFPSVLSWDIGAYTLRAMGLVPILYLIPALGLNWVFERVTTWRKGRTTLAAAVMIGILSIEGMWTARDYFLVWAPSFGASWEDGADAVAQARFLAQETHPDQELIFVGSEYYHYPTLAQLAGPVYTALHWFDGRQSVVFSPASKLPSLYVLGFNGMPSNATELFARGTLVGQSKFLQGIDGGAPPPLFLAYRLTPDQVQATIQDQLNRPGMHPVEGQMPGILEPLGATIPGPVKSGDTVHATLVWKVLGTLPEGDWQITAQLVDSQWHEISDQETLGYPPTEWQPGNIVVSYFDLPVPAKTPPGRYLVQVALFNRDTGARVTVQSGQPGIQALILGNLRVISAEPILPPTHPIGAYLGSSIELLGTDQPQPGPNNSLAVALQWKATQPVSQDYTVFVQLLNSDGKLVAQSDGWPGGGGLPTSSWLAGETIRDQHQLTLPPNLPHGQYRLIAGMYLLSTGQRLPIQSGGDFVELGQISL